METLAFSIRIGQENVIKLTEYLVRQDIPFSLESPSLILLSKSGSEQKPGLLQKKRAQEPADNNDQKVPMVSNHPLVKTSEVTISKEIIKLYLHGDFSQPIPTEVEIAKKFGLSTLKLKLIFRRLYGKTLYQMYMERRMKKAAFLLQSGHKAVEVARLVGYGANSSIKFNKMFQKYFGTTPKRFQVDFRKSASIRPILYG